MTQSRMEDMVIYQRPKIPKIEGLQLHQLIWDEPPSLDINNQGMGVNAIRNMLEVHNTALALVGACHLQRLRAYTLKFMGFLTQRLDSDLGLRPPNVLESQAADKALWQMIHDLVIDQKFTLDNALHEVTHLRSDMASLLQPRPKISVRPTSTSSSTGPQCRPKVVGNPKGSQNRAEKRATLLLVLLGSPKPLFKANDISFACNTNPGNVRRVTLASSVTCAPIHYHQDRRVHSYTVHLIISNNLTDSWMIMQRHQWFHIQRTSPWHRLDRRTISSRIQQWLTLRQIQ